MALNTMRAMTTARASPALIDFRRRMLDDQEAQLFDPTFSPSMDLVLALGQDAIDFLRAYAASYAVGPSVALKVIGKNYAWLQNMKQDATFVGVMEKIQSEVLDAMWVLYTTRHALDPKDPQSHLNFLKRWDPNMRGDGEAQTKTDVHVNIAPELMQAAFDRIAAKHGGVATEISSHERTASVENTH